MSLELHVICKGLTGIAVQGFPMAYIIEHAGGGALAGRLPVLDVHPQSIHERCPVFLGSISDIDRIQALISGAEKHFQL